MNFIAIKINGQYLDLPADAVINIEMENPIFDDGNVKGVLSFPFTIEQTKTNKRILGLPELIGNKNVNRVYSCNLHLGGAHGPVWISGLFRVRSISGGRYICNLNAAAANLAEAVRNKKLTQLEYDGERVINEYPYTSIRLTGAGTTGSVEIWVNGITKSVFFDTNINKTLLNLAFEFNSLSYLNDMGIAYVTVVDDRIRFHSNLAEDFPYYPEYLDTPNSDPGPGRTFTRDDFGNTLSVLDHLNVIINDIRLYPDMHYTFFPVKNPDAYGGSSGDYSGYINYWEGSDVTGTFLYNNGTAGNGTKYPITLFPYLLYVLDKVFSEHDFEMEGSFLDDQEIRSLVIYNNYLNEEVQEITTGQWDSWAKSFHIKNHVPDISIGDFIKALKNFFTLGFFFDLKKNSVKIIPLRDILASRDYDDITHQCEPENEIELQEQNGYTVKYAQDSADELIKERVVDLSGLNKKDEVEFLTDLPAADVNNTNDVRLVTVLNQFYKSIKYFDSSAQEFVYEWQFHSDNFNNLTVGNGKTEIANSIGGISGFHSESGAVAPDKNWDVPYVKQKCTTNAFGTSVNPFSFRLMFFRRLNFDYDGKVFPKGSTNSNYTGGDLYNYTLGVDGEKGLYNQWGKSWFDFINNAKVVTKKVRYTMPELLNLDLSKKKRISNQTFIIKKISIPVTMKGIGIATQEMYTA